MTDWHCCMPGHAWGDDGVCIRCGAYEPEKRIKKVEYASARDLAGFALRMVVERMQFRIDAMNERDLDGVSISKGFAEQIVRACRRGSELLENPEPAQAGLTAGGGSGSANLSEGVTGGGECAVGDAAGEDVPMNDDQIKYMIDRFLGWRLPEPWNPDNGISYQRPNYAHAPADHDWPTGTNLFDADQAEAMVRYMIEGLPGHPTPPAVEASDLKRAARIAELTTREVAELPDRTSPPDEPLLMLVTEHELAQIIEPLMSAEFAAIRREAAASSTELELELTAALRDIEMMIAGCPDAPLAPDSLPQMALAHARAVLAKATERGL